MNPQEVIKGRRITSNRLPAVKGFAMAFTLIELLVVIAIISMLVAMLLPALKKSKSMAKEKDCSSKQRQILIACMSYGSDFDGYLTPNAPGTNPGNYWGQVIVTDAWTTPRPWGMGLLMANNYIPMSSAPVLWCSGFEVDPSAVDASRYTGFLARQKTGYFGPDGLQDYTWSPYTLSISGRYGGQTCARLGSKYFNDHPLVIGCSSFAYQSYNYKTNFPSYCGGKPHDLSGCNYGFVDGHVKFYPMKWIISNGGGEYWPNATQQTLPWYWTTAKFNQM